MFIVIGWTGLRARLVHNHSILKRCLIVIIPDRQFLCKINHLLYKCLFLFPKRTVFETWLHPYRLPLGHIEKKLPCLFFKYACFLTFTVVFHLLFCTRHFCSKHPLKQNVRDFRISTLNIKGLKEGNSTTMMNVKEKFSWLNRHAPRFYIKGDQVQVITEPTQFYEILKVREKM